MSQSKLTYNIGPIYYIVYKLVYIFLNLKMLLTPHC